MTKSIYLSLATFVTISSVVKVTQSSRAFNYTVLIFIFTFYVASCASFLLLYGSDPGFLSASNLNSDASSLIYEDDENESLNYCALCELWVPIRSKHCRVCRCCVATFDHHCYLLGTCIGERNHCRFYWFLVVNAVSLCYGFGIHTTDMQSVVTINRIPKTELESTTNAIGYIVILPMLLFSIFLLVFHSLLAVGGTTGYECSRGAAKLPYLRHTQDCDLPFASVQNLFAFCCLRDACCKRFRGLTYVVAMIVARAFSSNAVAAGYGGIEEEDEEWRPERWKKPAPIVRDSDDVCAHPWQNKVGIRIYRGLLWGSYSAYFANFYLIIPYEVLQLLLTSGVEFGGDYT